MGGDVDEAVKSGSCEIVWSLKIHSKAYCSHKSWLSKEWTKELQRKAWKASCSYRYWRGPLNHRVVNFPFVCWAFSFLELTICIEAASYRNEWYFRAVARKKLQPRRTHGPLYEISRMKSSKYYQSDKKNKNRQYLVKFDRGECLGSPHTGYGGVFVCHLIHNFFVTYTLKSCFKAVNKLLIPLSIVWKSYIRFLVRLCTHNINFDVRNFDLFLRKIINVWSCNISLNWQVKTTYSWRGLSGRMSLFKTNLTGVPSLTSPHPLPRFYFFALLFSSHRSPLSERLEQAKQSTSGRPTAAKIPTLH